MTYSAEVDKVHIYLSKDYGHEVSFYALVCCASRLQKIHKPSDRSFFALSLCILSPLLVSQQPANGHLSVSCELSAMSVVQHLKSNITNVLGYWNYNTGRPEFSLYARCMTGKASAHNPSMTHSYYGIPGEELHVITSDLCWFTPDCYNT